MTESQRMRGRTVSALFQHRTGHDFPFSLIPSLASGCMRPPARFTDKCITCLAIIASSNSHPGPKVPFYLLLLSLLISRLPGCPCMTVSVYLLEISDKVQDWGSGKEIAMMRRERERAGSHKENRPSHKSLPLIFAWFFTRSLFHSLFFARSRCLPVIRLRDRH